MIVRVELALQSSPIYFPNENQNLPSSSYCWCCASYCHFFPTVRL